MKQVIALGIMVVVMLLVLGCEKASDIQTSSNETMPETVTAEAKNYQVTDVEVGKDAVCPVMGSKFKVNKNTLAAQYKDEVYYFCCGGCPEAFKNNPEKYINKE